MKLEEFARFLKSDSKLELESETIFFWKPVAGNGWFSNWYSCKFMEDNVTYTSSEQYFMVKKAELFMSDIHAVENKKIIKKMLETDDQSEIRTLGRKVQGFNEQVWKKNRLQIMINANILKFTQNRDLCQKLMDTNGQLLVEASPSDNIWGIGLTEEKAKKLNPNEWPGENLLGFSLMFVRDMLFNIYG